MNRPTETGTMRSRNEEPRKSTRGRRLTGRLLRGGVAVGALAAFISASAARADTVNRFGNNNGHASGSINWTGTKNFKYHFTVEPSGGAKVYVEFKGVRDNFPDSDWRRLTGDTTSRFTFSGSKSGDFGEREWSAVKFRICKVKPQDTDACGGDSHVVRR